MDSLLSQLPHPSQIITIQKYVPVMHVEHGFGKYTLYLMTSCSVENKYIDIHIKTENWYWVLLHSLTLFEMFLLSPLIVVLSTIKCNISYLEAYRVINHLLCAFKGC